MSSLVNRTRLAARAVIIGATWLSIDACASAPRAAAGMLPTSAQLNHRGFRGVLGTRPTSSATLLHCNSRVFRGLGSETDGDCAHELAQLMRVFSMDTCGFGQVCLTLVTSLICDAAVTSYPTSSSFNGILQRSSTTVLSVHSVLSSA